MKSRGIPKMATIVQLMLIINILQICWCQNSLPIDPWLQERPPNMPQILNLEVMCSKEHMEVQLSFDKPFNGLVFSKGQFGSDNCVYVHPKSGRTSFRFSIVYNGCGTKPDAKGKFYENTVVVQYDEELIEVWDEAKRLRCEWYNDYEKTATKPPMVIADLEVVELNFRGDNVDCWMEIQQGKGPWASPITGIVPLGSTLTMVVAINDHAGEFDMRVKSCEASDGVNRPIQLSDEHGCVLRPKMVSKFLKLRSNDGRSTVMSYAFFHAFKFPDSLQVFIRCKVEICRFGCPEHCDRNAPAGTPLEAYTSEAAASFSAPAAVAVYPKSASALTATAAPPTQEQIDIRESPPPLAPFAAIAPILPAPVVAPAPAPAVQYAQRRTPVPAPPAPAPVTKRPFLGFGRKPAPAAQGLIQKKKDTLPTLAVPPHLPLAQAQVMTLPIAVNPPPPPPPPTTKTAPPSKQSLPLQSPAPLSERRDAWSELPTSSRFPQGPRSLDFNKKSIHIGDIEPYALKSESLNKAMYGDGSAYGSSEARGGKSRRRRYALLERHVRSADVGVRVGYEVVSAVDLAFALSNSTTDGGTIFQGRIKEEIVYGICLPAPGFSALFVLLAMCVVISVLVAAFLCHHRQIQKADGEGVCVAPPQQSFQTVALGGWGAVHFQRNPKN